MDEVDTLKARVGELEEKLRTSIAAQERMAAALERSDIKARDKEGELVRIRAAERRFTHLVDGETITTALCGEKISPHFSDLDLTTDIEKCGCFKCLQTYVVAQQDGMRLLADDRDRLDAKVRVYNEILDRLPAKTEMAILAPPPPAEPPRGLLGTLFGKK